MYDRFTRKSRLGRGHIPNSIRNEVYQRDDYICQFCGLKFTPDNLTIDHLVPQSRGGLDEITNYVSCCTPCNRLKTDLPLEEFSKLVNITIEELPVHGDPVIDNKALPIQIRLLRKRIFDKARYGKLRIRGKRAQNKLEKTYRREFWQMPEGRAIEAEFSSLPGQVRIMIPEIQTIAKDEREYLLLVELAKSAKTRNLIGGVLTSDCHIESRLLTLESKTNDESLKKRIQRALQRYEKETKRRGL